MAMRTPIPEISGLDGMRQGEDMGRGLGDAVNYGQSLHMYPNTEA